MYTPRYAQHVGHHVSLCSVNTATLYTCTHMYAQHVGHHVGLCSVNTATLITLYTLYVSAAVWASVV